MPKTGGAGFIGANFVLDWLALHDEPVVNLDKLTYAGNLRDLASLQGDARHVFVQGDIGDAPWSPGCWPSTARARWSTSPPRAMWTAPSTARGLHPDQHRRHLHAAGIGAGVLGRPARRRSAKPSACCTCPPTRCMAAWPRRPGLQRDPPLRAQQPLFSQQGRQRPPGARLAPHLRPAGAHHQLQQQLRAVPLPRETDPADDRQRTGGQALPVYGDGMQIRDWLYVKDHCSAIRRVLEAGRLGETYNVGGWNEKPNIEIVNTVCALLDELRPRADGQPYAGQISYVKDRPGHDRRYAIDARKLEAELGWKPAETFETGIRKTVEWYLANPTGWHTCKAVLTATGSASNTPARPMKILLLGKNGQVGWELQRSLAPARRTGGPGPPQHRPTAADLSQPDLLRDTVRSCAPMSSSTPPPTPRWTRPRAKPTGAHLNALAPAPWRRPPRRWVRWLVHYSTDYVFDGSGKQAWTERATTGPLSVYGQTKLEGEQLIAEACEAPDLAHQLGVCGARRQLRQDHAAPGQGARAPDRDRRPVRRAHRGRTDRRRDGARHSPRASFGPIWPCGQRDRPRAHGFIPNPCAAPTQFTPAHRQAATSLRLGAAPMASRGQPPVDRDPLTALVLAAQSLKRTLFFPS
jgi:dTDP-glucose 4,6-dehydratase